VSRSIDYILVVVDVSLQDGVASYLGLLKGAKVQAAAKAIDDKMTSIMTAVAGVGFTNFIANYEAEVNTNIARYCDS
jgi:hypothetical protein